MNAELQAAIDARFNANNAAHWRVFCRDFPKTGPIRLRMALAQRILATTPPNSPAYAEAESEMCDLEKQLGPNGRFSADH
jgi:hypothetical protein